MDESANTILEMLTDLHGTVTGLSIDSDDADERLDIIEADLAAIIPLAAQTQNALDSMGLAIAEMSERLKRLESSANVA